MEDLKIDDNKNNNMQSTCVTRGDGIKFFTQVFFSVVLVVFAIFMIVSSKSPSDETLWISLLTSTAAMFTNPPSLNRK